MAAVPAVAAAAGSVDLLEALSTRSRLDPPVASEHTWMVSGLHETFDQAPLG